MSVGLRGDLRKIVSCIHGIQTPEKFTGIDKLTIESSEPEGLTVKLLVTQWYQTTNLSDGSMGISATSL